YIDSVAGHVSYPIIRWEDTSPELDDIFEPHPDGPGLRKLFRGGSSGDFRVARESNARVLLSGLGGDNLGIVEGYVADLIQAGRWRDALTELVSFPGATLRTRIERIRRVLRQFVPDSFDAYLRRRRKRTPDCLTPYARHIANSLGTARPALPPKLTNVQRALWRRVAAPETLRNISMMNIAASSHGCEYRFPYFDKDLVLFAMAAPLEFWPRPGAFARLHRDPLAEILPASIASRFGKAEFTPAVARKVQAAGTAVLKGFGTKWASRHYLDPDAARRFCQAVIDSGSVSDRRFVDVWAILTLEAWLRSRERLSSLPATVEGERPSYE
ncbi:MAG: asparagine synthase-related protein, partial [Terricaulis silvestris]